MQQIIIRPIITEKTTHLVKKGIYSFAVVKEASKGAIIDQIEQHFKVKVTRLNTLKTKSKTKRSLTKARMSYKTKEYKKAFAKLATGQKIDLFEVVEKKLGKAKKVKKTS
ncbi:50S ribosomal protein L23 [Candidatus Parcubacteria bacterium]|nr:50S ribosomal protein L23 [Patescibacteria group bacterium]MBU4381150.1 50S ribosomal protein L23 [Patescibacteria group bacterium]MCG2689127.1 50S ribosomal protein L23 [Candidatus Parcubacteria bacterium]